MEHIEIKVVSDGQTTTLYSIWNGVQEVWTDGSTTWCSLDSAVGQIDMRHRQSRPLTPASDPDEWRR